jgi:drug/metabolite transporter (DMT)-like permease
MTNLAHPILLGLIAALCWGTSDFCGGIATRRMKASTVMLATDIVTIFLMTCFAFFFSEQMPSWQSIGWGIAAGTAGTLGIYLLFSGLAIGPMGVVSALSAVIAAALPVLIEISKVGIPGTLALIGFVLAGLAVCLINFEKSESSISSKAIWFGIVSGIAFGILFTCLDQIEVGSAFWPLVASRILILPILVICNRGFSGVTSSLKQTPWLLLAIGALDSLGNAAYTIATQIGRLDEASVIGSMYPIITVALSLLILKECLSKRQSVALALAVGAVVCIAA